jgi:hypothetical protein
MIEPPIMVLGATLGGIAGVAEPLAGILVAIKVFL